MQMEIHGADSVTMPWLTTAELVQTYVDRNHEFLHARACMVVTAHISTAMKNSCQSPTPECDREIALAEKDMVSSIRMRTN